MNIELPSIVWGGLDRLWVLTLFALACGMVVYRVYRSLMTARALVDVQKTVHLLVGFSKLKLFCKAFLASVAVLCMVCALCMPRWGRKEQLVEQEGHDVVIALDVSRSMLAQDCNPDRLSVAKKKIETLLHYLPCERIALILFSGSAFVQCPLTTDYGAFKLFLDAVDADTIASGATAIDQAVTEALKMYEKCATSGNKLLIVVTDGEDFSTNLIECKKHAVQVGMHIFTLAIGTAEGAPIPLYTQRGAPNGFQLDEKGAVVVSRLNEEVVRALSHDVGGVYIPMANDDSDVKAIAKRVALFEKEKFGTASVEAYQEQYHYCIAVALICLVVEWFL